MTYRVSSRELLARLKELGCTVLPPKRGKGSHCMVVRTVDGKPCSTSVPMNRECVAPGTVGSIRRAVKLSPEDGVTNQQFFGH